MMTLTSRAVPIAAFLVCAIALPALAQNPDETGTGGGPRSTITAPNTTATGVTKPPGAAAGPEPNERDDGRRTRMEKRDDAIDTGICIGCNR